jgi:NAD(P)-dependent dehydrogenase (short-subunit alcohol dehydrogenase family)
MGFEGARVLVTGSSRGIGRGIALRFADEGANLAIHYLENEEAAAQTCEAVRSRGGQATLVRGDVADHEQVTEVVRKAAADLGGLDVFVSNARPELSAFFHPTLDITIEQWKAALDSQATAFLVGGREAAQHMAPGGSIVAITYATGSRTGGLQPWVAMGAAKAAMEATMRYLAVALAPREITVNAVSPGWTEDSVLNTLPPEAQDLIRGWHQRGWTPMRRLTTPADVGNVVSLLCRPEACFVTGQVVAVDGGASLMNVEVPPELQLQG